MKKLFLLLMSLTVFSSAEISLKQIENMVTKIHEKREGVKLETLDTTLEPFVRVAEDNTTVIIEPVMKKKEEKLVLHAIVNGKAYINDSWNVLDDRIIGVYIEIYRSKGCGT